MGFVSRRGRPPSQTVSPASISTPLVKGEKIKKLEGEPRKRGRSPKGRSHVTYQTMLSPHRTLRQPSKSGRKRRIEVLFYKATTADTLCWNYRTLLYQQLQGLSTLFSEFFASFPRGTCSLSVFKPYLDLAGAYLLICTILPDSATLRFG